MPALWRDEGDTYSAFLVSWGAAGGTLSYQGQGERLPGARRNIVVLFVLCVIPCAAPLAAIILAIWYWSNQETVRALPSLYGGLCKIALGLGIGQTVLIVIMVLLFSVFRVS